MENVKKSGPARCLQVDYRDWRDVGEAIVIYQDGYYETMWSPVNNKMNVLFFFSNDRTELMLKALDRMDIHYEIFDGDGPFKFYTEQPPKTVHLEKTVGDRWHEQAVKNSKRDAIIAAIATAALLVLITCFGYLITANRAEASEIEPDWSWKVYPSDHVNWGPYMRLRYIYPILEKFDEATGMVKAYAEEAAAQRETEYYEEVYYYPYYDYGYSYSGYSSGGVKGNPDGINSFDGTNEYGGRYETYYSSRVLYHENTAQWTLDDQGFYRTSDGYYVVASSDHPQGTIIDTSQGEAIVLDSGCESGVTDFYVNW